MHKIFNIIIYSNAMKEKISKNMLIADIVAKHPGLAEYIMDYGVHCIGCDAAMFETLGQGFSAHGMTEEEIDDAISELNKLLKDSKPKAIPTLKDKTVHL